MKKTYIIGFLVFVLAPHYRQPLQQLQRQAIGDPRPFAAWAWKKCCDAAGRPRPGGFEVVKVVGGWCASLVSNFGKPYSIPLCKKFVFIKVSDDFFLFGRSSHQNR